MEERITGSWPGGPRRAEDAGEPRRKPHLMRAEEIEAGLTARSAAFRRRARRKRAVFGFVFFVALAGGIGWALGLRSHATVTELTAESAAARDRDSSISKEVNRTLLELWKMEDVEALRNRGRGR